MSKKKYFYGLLGLFFLMQILYFVIGALVDPIELFGMPHVRGFNHFKVKQKLFCYVFHPYAYIREKPDVLYIGASQVGRGFEPKDISVYTMGLPGSDLSEVREYLRFVYRVHKPKNVYLGLSTVMFGKSPYYLPDKGYSYIRLQRLGDGSWKYCVQLAQDFFGIHDIYAETIKESYDNTEANAVFVHGWFAEEGRNKPINPAHWYKFYERSVERRA